MGGLVVPGQASWPGPRAHLRPLSRYVEWIAYFDSPNLCSFGPLTHQVPSFNRPCTLGDLDGPATLLGIARGLAEATTDTRGVPHLDGTASEMGCGRSPQEPKLERPAMYGLSSSPSCAQLRLLRSTIGSGPSSGSSGSSFVRHFEAPGQDLTSDGLALPLIQHQVQ